MNLDGGGHGITEVGLPNDAQGIHGKDQQYHEEDQPTGLTKGRFGVGRVADARNGGPTGPVIPGHR